MPSDASTPSVENDLGRKIQLLEAELIEARQREAATAQILRVISRSPTDIEQVLDELLKSAVCLCDADGISIFRRDEEKLLLIAHDGGIGRGRVGEFSLPLIRASVNGRAVLEAQSIHIADLLSEGREYPEASEIARIHGQRTELAVPLLRNGIAIGSISLGRSKVQPFTDGQIKRVETFADRAVMPSRMHACSLAAMRNLVCYVRDS